MFNKLINQGEIFQISYSQMNNFFCQRNIKEAVMSTKTGHCCRHSNSEAGVLYSQHLAQKKSLTQNIKMFTS